MNFKTLSSLLLPVLLFCSTAYASLSFRPAKTIDGVDVIYGDLNKLQIESGQSGPATAIYNELGAYILYDSNVVNHVSELAQYLILEHERAHHRLGHTLFTKIHRELKLPFSSFYQAQKEKDADCEAGYSLKDDSATFGDVSREDIKNAMSDIYYALSGSSNGPIPSWVMSRVDVIDVCYNGKLLPRPKAIEGVLNVFDQKAQGLSEKPVKRHHGPNCWNSALYMSELSHQVRFTSNEEFHHLMESPYCQTLTEPEPHAIKVYRVQLPLVEGSQREVHAAIWLDEMLSFNKMTAFSTSAYKIEEHREVDANYKFLSPVHRFTVQNNDGTNTSVGCENDKCENEILYKRCQSLREIESDIKREDYLETYRQLLRIEREISAQLFEILLVRESSREKLLAKLELLSKDLVNYDFGNDLEEWQISYFKALAQSLSEQLSMRQPNWLKP